MKPNLNEQVESNALNIFRNAVMALLRFKANIEDRSIYDGAYPVTLS